MSVSTGRHHKAAPFPGVPRPQCGGPAQSARQGRASRRGRAVCLAREAARMDGEHADSPLQARGRVLRILGGLRAFRALLSGDTKISRDLTVAQQQVSAGHTGTAPAEASVLGVPALEDPKRPRCPQCIPYVGVTSRKLPCALQRGAEDSALRPANSSTGCVLHMGTRGCFGRGPAEFRGRSWDKRLSSGF